MHRTPSPNTYPMTFSLKSPDDIAAVLSQRLRTTRLRKNLRQSDVAKMAGVSIGAVRTLERDGQTSMVTFIRVVQALGVARELEPLFEQRPMSIAELERIAATTTRQRAHPMPPAAKQPAKQPAKPAAKQPAKRTRAQRKTHK